MATVTGARTAHATLSTTTVDTVDLTQTGLRVFNIFNRSGSADLTVTFRCGPPGNTDAVVPVALASGTFLVPAGASLTIDTLRVVDSFVHQFKILGNGNAYSVQGLQ